jgi:hypothetical protein
VVGDQHRETRIRHNGPQPRFACRHRCRTNQRCAAAPRKWASSHFESCQQYDGARSGARGMAARPLPPAFPARWFDGLVMMRWGMPSPPRAGGFPVTNIRNTTSPHWRAWLKPKSRCLVPFNSFAEYAPEPNPETKKKDVVWFAQNDDRPRFKSVTAACGAERTSPIRASCVGGDGLNRQTLTFSGISYRGLAQPCRSPVTRQITSPTSSATRIEPLAPSVTPTGRP